MIIHLNGWPGVGKKTVGQLVSRKLDARFIHNHLLHDVAIACTAFSEVARWPLYEKIRLAAYDALASLPANEVIVMTNALCVGSERERAAWNHVVDLAILRSTPLIPIVLETTLEENLRRLKDPSRDTSKLREENLLVEYRATDEIQKPHLKELLVINTTSLNPIQVAEKICEHIASAKNLLRSADESYKRLS